MRHVEFFCHLPDSVTSALGAAISQCLAFFLLFFFFFFLVSPFSFSERFGNIQGGGGKVLKHFKRHFGKHLPESFKQAHIYINEAKTCNKK